MKPFCSHYSFENKTCKLFYDEKLLVNKEDLIPNCDGLKTPALCCWYNIYQRRLY